jgi:hypothetical protein
MNNMNVTRWPMTTIDRSTVLLFNFHTTSHGADGYFELGQLL